jgi:hypothetical protein
MSEELSELPRRQSTDLLHDGGMAEVRQANGVLDESRGVAGSRGTVDPGDSGPREQWTQGTVRPSETPTAYTVERHLGSPHSKLLTPLKVHGACCLTCMPVPEGSINVYDVPKSIAE